MLNISIIIIFISTRMLFFASQSNTWWIIEKIILSFRNDSLRSISLKTNFKSSNGNYCRIICKILYSVTSDWLFCIYNHSLFIYEWRFDEKLGFNWKIKICYSSRCQHYSINVESWLKRKDKFIRGIINVLIILIVLQYVSNKKIKFISIWNSWWNNN